MKELSEIRDYIEENNDNGQFAIANMTFCLYLKKYKEKTGIDNLQGFKVSP